jgi:hypothetical protein
MSYRLAADAVALVHLAFVVFVLLGALLALKWRWIPWVHLPTAAWGLFNQLSGRACPLTGIESDLRVQAGEPGYAGGFIEHYLLDALYPSGVPDEVQYVLSAAVFTTITSIYAWLHLRHWRSRRTDA